MAKKVIYGSDLKLSEANAAQWFLWHRSEFNEQWCSTCGLRLAFETMALRLLTLHVNSEHFNWTDGFGQSRFRNRGSERAWEWWDCPNSSRLTGEHPEVWDINQKPAAVPPGTHGLPSQNEVPSWEATMFCPHDEDKSRHKLQKGQWRMRTAVE